MKSLYLDENKQELNYEEILLYIRKIILSYIKTKSNLIFFIQKESSIQDLASSCFLFFLETGFFSKYNKEKSKLSTYLYSSTLNYLKNRITFYTRKKRLFTVRSIDESSFLQSSIHYNVFYNKSSEISDFFDRVTDNILRTPTISFSKRKKVLSVLECLRKGMKREEISSDLSISRSDIQKLEKSLFKLIRENYENPIHSRSNTI